MKSSELSELDANHFWKALSDTEMMAFEGMAKHAELGKRHAQLVCEKVDTICNAGRDAHAVLVALRELGKLGATAEGFGQDDAPAVAQDICMVVFAPGYPPHMDAKDRALALAVLLDRCAPENQESKDAHGLAAAMDNPVGKQILKAVKQKLELLEESMGKCSDLKAMWSDIKLGTSSDLKCMEDAVRSAPSPQMAAEIITAKELMDVQESYLKSFIWLHYPQPSQDAQMYTDAPNATLKDELDTYLPSLKDATGRHSLHESTKDCS